MLRIDETSELTTLPVSTLRYLRHLGEGPPAFRLGRRLVYDEADVLAWIAERKAADPAPRQRAGLTHRSDEDRSWETGPHMIRSPPERSTGRGYCCRST